MSTKQKSRRKLNRSELRLILFADMFDENESGPGHRLHVVRQTVKGEKIAACHLAQKMFLDELNYWDFPMLNFFLSSGQLCLFCEKMLREEGILETP